MSLMELLILPSPGPAVLPETVLPETVLPETVLPELVSPPALPPPDPGTRAAGPAVALLASVTHLASFTGRGTSLVIGPATVSVSPRAVAIDDLRALAVERDRAEWRVRFVATRGKPLLARVSAADGAALVEVLRDRVVPTLVGTLVSQMQLGEIIEVGELQLSHRYLRVGRREAAWGHVEVEHERNHLIVRDVSRDRKPVLARVSPDAPNAFVLAEVVTAGALAFPSPW